MSNQEKLFSYLKLLNQTKKNTPQNINSSELTTSLDLFVKKLIKKVEIKLNKLKLSIDNIVQQSDLCTNVDGNEF
jgi:anionic cell wall polymer biosynthesis LytR-Cps2A-Psr (LCP) family protein